MVKRFIMLFVGFCAWASLHAQVAEMKWELDFEVYLKMQNDSNYTYSISELLHITDVRNLDYTTEFIFYPVHPGESYSKIILEKDTARKLNYNTLWGTLHARIGGGWIHFTNCIAYALETQILNLREPIMVRPETAWKPKPATKSWKRTRKWKYYVPVSQKLARREYRKRIREKVPDELDNLPESYIRLFLDTSDKDYMKMRDEGKLNELAKIDLVKVILGANYLGEEQISYISHAVFSAITEYSGNLLPTVLIFDEFDAAAAMSLNRDGYVPDEIVFRTSAGLTDKDMQTHKKDIQAIIRDINRYNKEAFQKRLGNYYGN